MPTKTISRKTTLSVGCYLRQAKAACLGARQDHTAAVVAEGDVDFAVGRDHTTSTCVDIHTRPPFFGSANMSAEPDHT
jgi:hypothetical protein